MRMHTQSLSTNWFNRIENDGPSPLITRRIILFDQRMSEALVCAQYPSNALAPGSLDM